MKWDFSDTYLTILICIVILGGGIGFLGIVFDADADVVHQANGWEVRAATDPFLDWDQYKIYPGEFNVGMRMSYHDHSVVVEAETGKVLRIEIIMKKTVPHVGCLVLGCDKKDSVTYQKDIYTPNGEYLKKTTINGKWVEPKDGYIAWE